MARGWKSDESFLINKILKLKEISYLNLSCAPLGKKRESIQNLNKTNFKKIKSSVINCV